MSIRLYLTAEGETEERFAAQVIGPHLAACSVYLAGIRLTALCKKKGRVHRGGVSHYLAVKNDICRWLKQDRNQDARFTTMIDLYGLPNDFPGYDEASRLQDPFARVAAMEGAFAKDIQDSRFIPYIQLHEFEALLFSQIESLGTVYTSRRGEITELERLSAAFKSPELIDDGENSAPSKRIGQKVPEYLRAKSTVGPILAAEIGLDVVRGKCPHFNDWLVRLERLGSAGCH